MDIVSAEDVTIAPGARHAVATGLAVAIPHGFEIQVRPRSGLALKHGITVPNAPGTIDPDYRGEVKVILINHGTEPFAIVRGDRVGQLVVAPVVQGSWLEVEELDATARGEGGFGSTEVWSLWGIEEKGKAGVLHPDPHECLRCATGSTQELRTPRRRHETQAALSG
jgi:dUTP pyrophosphatase